MEAEVTCVPPNVAGYLHLCEWSDPSAAVPLSQCPFSQVCVCCVCVCERWMVSMHSSLCVSMCFATPAFQVGMVLTLYFSGGKSAASGTMGGLICNLVLLVSEQR